MRSARDVSPFDLLFDEIANLEKTLQQGVDCAHGRQRIRSIHIMNRDRGVPKIFHQLQQAGRDVLYHSAPVAI
jgi:hypothetical protein